MPTALHQGGTVVVEADGPHGKHGTKESRAADGQYDGADGGDGRSARPPSAGVPAGQVTLALSSSPTQVAVDGKAVHTGRAQTVRTEIALNAFDTVQVDARGGRGGDGGIGGHGGDGRRGRRGNDATRYSWGTNGGRGGDGGAGGKGTHGAPGGDGGEIVVEVAEQDTFLLMAVEGADHPAPLVAGGKGGEKGRHGDGGNGGRGGSGGSSYSWTESYTTTDSQGNTVTQSRMHSNPGGADGPRGSDGHTPRTMLTDGRDGENGAFRIAVKGAGATSTYPRRYDLSLHAFDIDEPDDLDNDGILEFGERIRTKNFHFENVGGMPTPSSQRVRLQLQAGELVRPRVEEAFLRRSLGVHEAVIVPEALHFDIVDPDIDAPGDPLVWREEVIPQAWQLGNERGNTLGVDALFQRQYKNVVFSRTIAARFPLRNTSGTRVLRSLAPGEGTRFEFLFENISRVSLGVEAQRKRAVAMQLWLAPGAQVRPDQVAFIDDSGTRHPFAPAGKAFFADGTRSGWVCDVPVILAQSEGNVRGAIWIADDVDPWAAVTLRVSLLLDRLTRETAPEKGLRCVQQREFTVRAEPGYDWNAHNRVLLLAHDGVSREAWRAWHEVLEDDFGLGTDDWSLTRYGHIDFDADPGDGTSLRAHLQDRLVVVLNHPFHPTGDEVTQLPSDYLQARDFRTAAVAEGTRALVVGDPKFELQEWLAPVRDVRASGVDAPSIAALLKKEKTSADRLVQEEFREDPTISWDTAKVHKKAFYFFTPDENAMAKKSRKLLARLEEIHPGRRYVVVQSRHETPKKVGHSWWFGLPIYELGTVEVRRTLDDDRAFSVVLPASVDQAGAGSFITSEPNRFAIALALPFEEKLASLDRVLNRGDTTENLEPRHLETAHGLVRAILIDLIEEQEALKKRRATLTDDVLAANLIALNRLTAYPLRTEFPATNNRYDPLVDLWTGFSAYLESQKRWYRLFGRKRAIRRHSEDKLEVFAMNVFNAGATDGANDNVTLNSDTARERMLAQRAGLLEKIKSYRRLGAPTGGELGDVAGAHLFRQYLRDGNVTRDMDLFQSLDERLWEKSDLLRASAREARREQAQNALRARNAAERTALLLAPHAAGKSVAAGEWSEAQRQQMAAEVQTVAR